MKNFFTIFLIGFIMATFSSVYAASITGQIECNDIILTVPFEYGNIELSNFGITGEYDCNVPENWTGNIGVKLKSFTSVTPGYGLSVTPIISITITPEIKFESKIDGNFELNSNINVSQSGTITISWSYTGTTPIINSNSINDSVQAELDKFDVSPDNYSFSSPISDSDNNDFMITNPEPGNTGSDTNTGTGTDTIADTGTDNTGSDTNTDPETDNTGSDTNTDTGCFINSLKYL